MIKTSIYVATASLTWITAEIANPIDWGNLPAWGVVALGFGFMLKFVVGDLSKELQAMNSKLDRLVELQLAHALDNR